MRSNNWIISLMSVILLSACNNSSEFSQSLSYTPEGVKKINRDSSSPSSSKVALRDIDDDIVDDPDDQLPGEPPVFDPQDQIPAPPPVVNDPVDPSQPKEDKCKYSFSATSMGENVKLTIISGPLDIIVQLKHEELLKLSPDDQKFLSEALKDQLSDIPVVAKRSGSYLKGNEKMIIKNSNTAEASFNQTGSGITMNYLVKGNKASISATGLNHGSRIYAVLDGETGASLSFNTIESDTEIFAYFVTKGDNITCVGGNGLSGNISSYVYGQKGFKTSGTLSATSFDNSKIITHYVSGGPNTNSLFGATSLNESHVRLTTIGEENTQSKVRYTSANINNTFDIKLKGKDKTDLNFSGTSAGRHTVVNLDIDGSKETGASFRFTSEQDIHITGKIRGVDPFLNLSHWLSRSQVAQVDAILEKK
jgi:hypothetical protein